MTRWRERMSFLKNALSYREAGAVTMSSKYVVQKVLKLLDTTTLNTIIEYGPGSGAMTKALLASLSPQSKLIVIEPNAQFVHELEQIADSRLEVIKKRVQDLPAAQIESFGQVDAVISSLPFSFLQPAERLSVVASTHKMLTPGGSFVVFHQYSRLMLRPLKNIFGSVAVLFEPRNFLPCFIMHSKK